jgi:hypothetical protein
MRFTFTPLRYVCMLCILSVIILLPLYSLAQGEVLTNQTVLQLHKAGLSKDIIKTKIANSSCTFDLSTDALLALKKAGVSDEVVTAMFGKGNTTTESKPAKSEVTLESGVYYYNTATRQYDEMDGSVITNSKIGGLGDALKRSVSGLFNTKSKAALSGSEANLKITTTTPLFVFVFEKEKGTLSSTGSYFAEATSPNEFFLVKLAVVKNSRELVVGKQNSVGSNVGIADEMKVSFTSKKLQKGVYEVTTSNPLAPGQYCFMFAASSLMQGATHKVFDFTIRP